MIFQHVTKSEYADNIRSTGFSLDAAGSHGGAQMGRAVYLSQNPDLWLHKLADQSDMEVLDVEVDMACVLDDLREFPVGDFDAWAVKNGYLDQDGPTAKFQAKVAEVGGWFDDALWHVKAEYLQAQGFDGMWDRKFCNLVIWNLEVLKVIDSEADHA